MKKQWLLVTILLAIVLIGVVWYLASPLFIDKTVDEKLPVINSEANPSLTTLYEGNFIDADNFHKTSGKAIVFDSDGKKYLRFEDFQATNGPDLKVYLSNDLDAQDYISLGDLKGNIGDQNYEINDDIDLDNYNNVLIWCEQFSVLFGNAQLE